MKITVVKRQTYTHTQTHTHTHKENIYIYTYVKEKKIIKRKTVPPSLPKKKKDSCNTLDGRPHSNSQRIGAVNCCLKELYLRCRSYPRFS